MQTSDDAAAGEAAGTSDGERREMVSFCPTDSHPTRERALYFIKFHDLILMKMLHSGKMQVISPISLLDMPNSNGAAQETSNNLLTRLIPNAAQQQAPKVQLTSDQKKFLQFAEKHRTVLNQILRQSTVHLSDGPFAVLVDHTRILDFDVKRRYFRTELERMDEGIRREELAVHVHRVTVFEDSFRELYRRNPEEWKNRFYIVFEGNL